MVARKWISAPARLMGAALVATVALAGAAEAHGPQGQGMIGPGMKSMMGPQGMYGGFHATLDWDFDAEDIKRIVDGRLAWLGLSRLKVGDARALDKDTVEVKVVTKDRSVAAVMKIDRTTGRVKSID
ncbi:MAG: hypothetical protein RIB80_03570 [Rhodospirillales bacterium]